MRILVIGSGAREHTFCWALKQSAHRPDLFCLPGNAGIAEIAEQVPLNPADSAACAQWAKDNDIDLTIVGPEDPLAHGFADTFRAAGLRCLGPSKFAAQIESSKVWAKEFMLRNNIPTAPAFLVNRHTLPSAIQKLQNPEQTYPIAVKADGLAAGKGVVIAANADEAVAALRAMIEEDLFGAAGATVLVESFLYGREVSVFAISDGTSFKLLGAACDHKRAFDNDEGPNTGGMGAYSPPEWLPETMLRRIEDGVIAPTIWAMAKENNLFSGFLFAGLMITGDGPKVIEFNARMGDPETQVILPRILQPDFMDLCFAAADGILHTLPEIQFSKQAACGVVIAAQNYPESGIADAPISGLDSADKDRDILLFHAGVRKNAAGELTAHGGRILTMVGMGNDVAAARAKVYANITAVSFAGSRFRADIGQNSK